MRQASGLIAIQTPGRGLVEITGEVAGWTRAQGIGEGLLTLFLRHTSASLLIQENAAAAVRADLEAFFERLAPEAPGRYAHDDEPTSRACWAGSASPSRSAPAPRRSGRGRGSMSSSIGVGRIGARSPRT